MGWLSAGLLWLLVLVLGALVARRDPPGLRRAGGFAVEQFRGLALRMPLAILTASFLAEILPSEMIAGAVGDDSGLGGIIVASLLGGLLPGGPMVSFPIAVFLWQGGAGVAQLTALIAGWSVFAIHRILAFEAPVMGWRFVALRVAASLVLPPLAGLAAAALLEAGAWPALAGGG